MTPHFRWQIKSADHTVGMGAWHVGNSVLQAVAWGNSTGRGAAEHLHDAVVLGVAEQLHVAMHERSCRVARATASTWVLLRSGNTLSATQWLHRAIASADLR